MYEDFISSPSQFMMTFVQTLKSTADLTLPSLTG